MSHRCYHLPHASNHPPVLLLAMGCLPEMPLCFLNTLDMKGCLSVNCGILNVWLSSLNYKVFNNLSQKEGVLTHSYRWGGTLCLADKTPKPTSATPVARNIPGGLLR